MKYRHALITGASSGFGHDLAMYFAEQGVHVFAAARGIERLESLRAEAPAGMIEPWVIDVSDADATEARVRSLDADCGGLDLVIANAGIGEETDGKQLHWSTVKQVIDINVLGATATLCGAIPGMVARGRGQLVGMSSIAALKGLPRGSAYCASKSFLSTFLESLRFDLAPCGVVVTTIQPGFVKNEMTTKHWRRDVPFVVEQHDAVKRIVNAIVRGDSELTFPWQLHMMMKMANLAPRALVKAVVTRLRS